MVDYLLVNGSDPLALDRSRRNTALLWAATNCHAGCVSRLLAGRARVRLRGGGSCGLAEVPCIDEDGR